MNQLSSFSGLKVGEVYSMPRVSAEAQRLGGPPGCAFDIKNGFDLNKAYDKGRCFRELEQADPELLLVCPPCGPFSPLQEWNYKRMVK